MEHDDYVIDGERGVFRASDYPLPGEWEWLADRVEIGGAEDLEVHFGRDVNSPGGWYGAVVEDDYFQPKWRLTISKVVDDSSETNSTRIEDADFDEMFHSLPETLAAVTAQIKTFYIEE